MIKLNIWDRLYTNTFDWVLRRLDPECLKFYEDREEDWIKAILAFNSFQQDLFHLYGVNYKSGNKYKKECVKGLELTHEQLYSLYQEHLLKNTNYTVRYFLFRWWTNLRKYVENGVPELDAPYKYFKPATDEEISQARINFSHVKEKHWYDDSTFEHDHTFNKARVLEYRGHRFIVDDEWGDAWTLDKKGDVQHFQLVWDWWFPIDQYLDLYNI